MERQVEFGKKKSTTKVCRIPPRVVKRTYSMDRGALGFLRQRKVGISFLVIILLIAAWSPWITDDYARNTVIEGLGGPDATYYYLGENVTIAEIPIYTMKVPFAIFVYFPGEAMFVVPFWGGALGMPSLGLGTYGD